MPNTPDPTQHTIAYIVMAEMDYEGGRPVCVFSDEVSAMAFTEACNEHRRAQPRSPDFDADADSDGDAFDKWDAAHREWDSNHPAGEGGWYCDRFAFYPIRMLQHRESVAVDA